MKSAANVLEKLPSDGLLAEGSVVIRGDGRTLFVFDATAGNTEMFGIDHDGDILSVEDGFEGLGYLAGQALLNLRPLRIMVDQSVDLAQSDDPSRRTIGHMGPSRNRKEMVFTGRIEGDVLLHQHFPVLVGVVEGPANRMVVRIQSLEDLLDVHLGHAAGCAGQAVVAHVESEGLHDFPEQGGDAVHLLLVGQVESVRPKGGIHRCADVIVSDHVRCVLMDGAR